MVGSLKLAQWSIRFKLRIVLSLVCLAYFIISLIYRPIVGNDALQGMLSLHNYLNGEAWNKVLTLSQGNLAVTTSELTWWAPGQYQIPYFVSKILFVNIGTAVAILSFTSILAGSYFYCKIFKLSGLSSEVVLCALVVLLLQRFININIIQYSSSDLFLFFYTPFYLYIYYFIIKIFHGNGLWKFAILYVLNLFGLFIKNSFLLFELALNVFLITEYLFSKIQSHQNFFYKTQWINLLKGALILLPFIAAFLTDYYLFLRLGDNPANSYGLNITVSGILAGLLLPIAEILFASLSISGIYGNLFNKINVPDFVISGCMVILLLLMVFSLHRNRHNLYATLKKNWTVRLVTVISVLYVLYWLAFTLRRSAISNEDRLFLPIAILVFPYLLNCILKSSAGIKYLFVILIFLSVSFGVSSFVLRIKKYAVGDSVSSKDPQLQGFKILSPRQDHNGDMANLARIISQKYPHHHIVISDPGYAFELGVNNQFVLSPMPIVKQKDAKRNNLLFLSFGKNRLPWFTQIYVSDEFILYQPN